MRLRLGAAAVLAACLFLPLSTCTYQGKTQVKIPVRDLEPMPIALVFCGPLILIVAERLRPRLSPGGVVLLALQIPSCLYSAWQIFAWALFDNPREGFYLSYGALIVIFVTAFVELIRQLRSHAPAPDPV